MKKICVLTGTRAEYGLLYHTIKAIEKSEKLELRLIVTGSHLSPAHGMTVNEIKKDGLKIDFEIDMLLNSANKSAIAKSMGLLIIQLSNCFEALNPDMLLILGDRYEILAAASCAVAMNIPIAHMSGGEITEGAIDEQIRHAVTKMAHIHFVHTEEFKRNVLGLGEQEFRIFNVGDPSVENIKKYKFMGKRSVEEELGIDIRGKLFLVTYHPVTLMDSNTEEQMSNILRALDSFDGTFIFTGANADFDGAKINEMIKAYACGRDGSYFFQSLGHMYMNICKYADVMAGNSSSGIVESVSFNLPVVNIGDRQKGRLRHDNIIDVDYSTENIIGAINMALFDEGFKNSIKHIKSAYGDGNTSSLIVNLLENLEINEAFLVKSL